MHGYGKCCCCISYPAPPVTPVTPTVAFPIPGQQFTITWDEPPLSMGGTVDTYFVNISGPDDLCGNINTLQRFGSSTRTYIFMFRMDTSWSGVHLYSASRQLWWEPKGTSK